MKSSAGVGSLVWRCALLWLIIGLWCGCDQLLHNSSLQADGGGSADAASDLAPRDAPAGDGAASADLPARDVPLDQQLSETHPADALPSEGAPVDAPGDSARDAGADQALDAAAGDLGPSDLCLPTDAYGDAPPSTPAVCLPGSWCWSHPLPFSGTLNDLWIDSMSDVYGVGDNGLVVRRTYEGWSVLPTPDHTTKLRSVSGYGQGRAFAVGGQDQLWQIDAATLTPSVTPFSPAIPVSAAPSAVWTAGADQIFVGGQNCSFTQFDGTSWQTGSSPACNGALPRIVDLWATQPDQLYALTFAYPQSSLWRYDGLTAWTEIQLGTSGTAEALWGTADQIFAVAGRQLVQVDRQTSQVTPLFELPSSDPLATLTSVYGTGPLDLYASSNQGVVYHRGADGQWDCGVDLTTAAGPGAQRINRLHGSKCMVWAVGPSLVSYSNGVTWTSEIRAVTRQPLKDLWGAGDSVYAVGQGALLMSLDTAGPAGWSLVPTPGDPAHEDYWSVWSDGTALFVGGKQANTTGFVYWRASPLDPWQLETESNNPAIASIDRGITDIWGDSPTNLFFTTEQGGLGHYDGQSWTSIIAGPTSLSSLNAIWGDGAGHAVAVGNAGILEISYSGGNIGLAEVQNHPCGYFHLYDVWTSGPGDTWVAGAEGLCRFDGLSWSLLSQVDGEALGEVTAVWGRRVNNASEIFALTSSGQLLTSPDGQSWSLSPAWPGLSQLTATSSQLFAAGGSDILVHPL